jgi:hypothetical protein
MNVILKFDFYSMRIVCTLVHAIADARTVTCKYRHTVVVTLRNLHVMYCTAHIQKASLHASVIACTTSRMQTHLPKKFSHDVCVLFTYKNNTFHTYMRAFLHIIHVHV